MAILQTSPSLPPNKLYLTQANTDFASLPLRMALNTINRKELLLKNFDCLMLSVKESELNRTFLLTFGHLSLCLATSHRFQNALFSILLAISGIRVYLGCFWTLIQGMFPQKFPFSVSRLLRSFQLALYRFPASYIAA